MWIAILIGLAVGLLAAMFVLTRQERGYRLLFSDTHLIELGRCLEAARSGTPARTFEGVAVTWERLPRHVALTLAAKSPIAPPAAGFLLSFAIECAHRSPASALRIDKVTFALVWPAGALDLGRALVAVDDTSLPALRAAAADRMKAIAISDASLAAYR